MKKLLLFAAVAGLGLVSASPPDKGPDNGPREARRHYPPCSRTVTDRCIQLYERGRHDRHDLAREEPRARPDRYADNDHMMRHDRRDEARDMHRRHREGYAVAEIDVQPGPGPDSGHRWCREHHAYDDGHHDRMMVERVRVERRVVRPAAMAARVSRVVSCRCAPPAHRQIAQRVRRAGERG